MSERRHILKGRRNRRMVWPVIPAVVAILLAACLAVLTLGQQTGVPETLQTAAGHVPAISAGAAILVDAGDGTVLYEYNADKKMYPASTTKIMTALVVLELCEEQNLSLENELNVPAEAEGVEGSSLYLKAGERLTLEELMYGLMLQSGNDAAAALGTVMGGGGEEGLEWFVKRMNETAERLGCTGTHFMNPHGLYDEDHYTTARDLAVIARAAMQYEPFRQIAAAKEWGGQDGTRKFANKNKTVFQYEGGDGVKIGFTKASGRTLAASATRNGTQLIAVVLNDGNWFADAYALLDYGFDRIGEEG